MLAVVFAWISLFISFCNGFATIDEFAKVLDVFKDTKFHDNQLLSALCITQYEFLKRHKSFKGKKPEFYEECPYDEWHKSSNSSKALFDVDELESIQDEFESAVAAPDLRSMKPTEHFDIESFITETNTKLAKDRKNLLQQMKAGGGGTSFSDIREKLGEMLHTIQDFYSHTNWVELGNEKINPMLGMGSNLGVQLNGENDVACKPCAKEFTDEEQKEVDDAFGGLLTAIPLRIVGRKDNVYSCRGNMVTKFLTAGYYESEKDFKAMPEGKCTHGGLTDNYGGDGPTVGGINKDAATVLMSPHYYLHHIAANLSVKATIKYFEDIRTSLNNERIFGKLIGIEVAAGSSKEVSSKAFVIDTTGSMAKSIGDVKIFIEKFINKDKNETLQYFVTPFNDPEHGPVQGFNDPQQAIAAVQKLSAQGGGSLSEKMYAALAETARTVPESTSIYVFTDSASKNCRLLASIKGIAAKKNLQINFFMPGFTKKPRTPRSQRNPALHRCETEESIEDYRKLALATNGQFVIASGHNLQKAAESLTDSNWQRSKMFTDIKTPFNETIEFDSSVSEVEISMNAGASENLNNVRVDIVDVNDTNVVTAENILISNVYTKVFRFEKPEGSPWTILIDGNNQSIAQIDVKVKSNISANVMITDSDSKKSVRGALKPGQKYDITITCASCADITKVVVSRCGDNSPIMPPQKADKCGRKWCVEDIKLPPVSGDNQFCISYAGNFKDDDSGFERIAAQKLSTSALNLNTTFSTDNDSVDDPGEVFPNDNITIGYEIENLGESDDEVLLKVTSSVDLPMKYYKEPIQIGKGKKAVGNIYINANAAVGSMIDLEISATSKSDPSQHSSDEYTVFVTDPDADLAAPECTIDYSTAISCPKDPKDCDNGTYVVLLSFNDVDSGVSTVNYPRGEWQITDRNLFHSTSAKNHTFYAMGVHSCCEDAEFNVMDKEGLIGQCSLETYKKAPSEAIKEASSSSSSMIRISVVFVFLVSYFLRV